MKIVGRSPVDRALLSCMTPIMEQVQLGNIRAAKKIAEDFGLDFIVVHDEIQLFEREEGQVSNQKIQALAKTMIEQLGELIADASLSESDNLDDILERIGETFTELQDEVFVLQEGEED